MLKLPHFSHDTEKCVDAMPDFSGVKVISKKREQ